MTPATTTRLAGLLTDPALAPLARLQEVALSSLEREPAWREAAAEIAFSTDAVPLLDGATLRVPVRAARTLLAELAAASDAEGLDELDPVALIEAAITQSDHQAEALAAIARMEPAALMAHAHLVAWPLLLAIGERARALAAERPWTRGHCPVCASWPLIAELRGIDRTRVMRCGRCAAEWTARHIWCPFCGNDDHRTLGHLAAEDQRESRRAATCDRCHAYVKSFATLRPLDVDDLAYTDLSSVDLDVIALDRGYGRPTAPAYALRVSVEEEDR